MDREKVRREIKINKPSECVNVDLIVVMFCDNSGSYKRDTDQAVCNMVVSGADQWSFPSECRKLAL